MASYRFGTDFSHSDFVIPIAIIELYDEKLRSRSPYTTMYIRMGGTFSTAIRAAYEDAQGILGTPFQAEQEVASKLKQIGIENVLGGLQQQVVKAVIGGAGMAASGGQSSRAQIEFLSRVFLSNFQQVVYRGPQFRMFTLPFTMKPTSKSEAVAMRNIINTLKIASVPKLGATSIGEAISQFGGGEVYSGETEGKEKDFITSEDAQNIPIAPSSPITFGYPDICKFKLALYGGGSTLDTVFESKFCVFEAVTTDYGGSSNKMTFFEDGYFPTEATLTLNLKELEFETTESVINYARKQYQIS